MPQHSHIIDLEVPEDFPRAPLERFHDAVLSHRQSNKAEWGHWAGGCNGFHYRFLACADVDEAFRTSIGSAGPSPPPPERARQELALFAFLSSGLSALECLGYGLYFVGAIVEPMGFAGAPNRIWFHDVADLYQARFARDRLTHELLAVNGSTDLSEWRRARNILMHREAPGRAHIVGKGADRLGRPLSSATPSTGESGLRGLWPRSSMGRTTSLWRVSSVRAARRGGMLAGRTPDVHPSDEPWGDAA